MPARSSDVFQLDRLRLSQLGAPLFFALTIRVSTEVDQVILALGVWSPGSAAQRHATKFARDNADKSGLTKQIRIELKLGSARGLSRFAQSQRRTEV